MNGLAIGLLLLSLVVPGICLAGPKAPGVLDEEEIVTGEPLAGHRVVGIRLFSTDAIDYEDVDEDEMRKMKSEMKDNQRRLATKLRNKLRDAGMEAFVIEDDDIGTGNADMVIQGRFTMVNMGSAAARELIGLGAGQVGVATEGSLVDAKTGETLAKFAHEKTSGLAERFDKWLMLTSRSGAMGNDIAEFIVRLR